MQVIFEINTLNGMKINENFCCILQKLQFRRRMWYMLNYACQIWISLWFVTLILRTDHLIRIFEQEMQKKMGGLSLIKLFFQIDLFIFVFRCYRLFATWLNHWSRTKVQHFFRVKSISARTFSYKLFKLYYCKL